MQNNMRLIDANALINKKDAMFEIKELAKEIARQNGGVDDITLYLKEAYDRIAAAPTIDAVPVVRCVQCINYDAECGYCEYWETGRHTDDYCSLGAKTDGGDPHG